MSAEEFYALPDKASRSEHLRKVLTPEFPLRPRSAITGFQKRNIFSPSGHSFSSMMFATFFLAMGLTYFSGRRLWVFYLLVLWAVAVCFSRPILRQHIPRPTFALAQSKASWPEPWLFCSSAGFSCSSTQNRPNRCCRTPQWMRGRESLRCRAGVPRGPDPNLSSFGILTLIFTPDRPTLRTSPMQSCLLSVAALLFLAQPPSPRTFRPVAKLPARARPARSAGDARRRAQSRTRSSGRAAPARAEGALPALHVRLPAGRR